MFEIGTVTEFSDVNSIMDPQILIAAKAVKIPYNVGAVYQMMRAPMAPIANDKFDVYGRSVTSQLGVLGADISNAVLNINIADTKGVIVGAVLKIEDELVVVKSVDSATNVTLFARGAGGTTPAPHTTGVKWDVTSYAGRDVDLKNVGTISEQSEVFENYAQLFQEAIDYTFRAKQLTRQGLSPEQIDAILTNEALIRVIKKLSRTALNGLKDAGSVGTPHMTAGIYQQFLDTNLPTNNLDAGAVFDEDILKAGIENAFVNGSPDVIIVSPKNKGIANAFNLASTNVDVTTPLNNTTAGGFIDTYVYEGRVLRFVTDADAADDKIVIADSNNLVKGWMLGDALRVMEETPLSSREMRKSIQGSIGFAVENPLEGACIYNIG